MKFDSRITPIKSNLAASSYKYIVKRAKYSKGTKYTVVCSFTPLYSDKKSKLSTQLLFGEECIAYEVSKGWSWVQSLRDQYVGYTPTANLSRKLYKPTHKVTSLRTYIYKEPNIKSKDLFHLSFNSVLEVKKITSIHKNIFFYNPYYVICPDKKCISFNIKENQLSFRDKSHLTIEGSLLLKKDFEKFYLKNLN